jgi:hypothetical protein
VLSRSLAVDVSREQPGEPPLLIAPEEETQGTFDCERAVLVVARTVTSTSRLLEALRFFRDDFRIKLIFTVNDTSPYSAGVHELLRSAGVEQVVPWSGVGRLNYALAISASENIDFEALRGRPVVVLPHGVGFNKYVPDPVTGGTRLAGLPPAAALRSGRVRLVLGHPDQQRQLRAVAPEVDGHTVVTGDPTYDQLLAGQPLRERYRRKLGVRGRTLVVLSSTWRRESEIGRWRTLPREMAASLPADEYQVAMVLHPNIWAYYGTLQVRTWFSDALEAGVLLIPPTQGWQAALLAAHVVVGDHGSLSLYTAGLGTPLLLAAFGDETVVGTPIDLLGRTADHLDRNADLRAQVNHALAAHTPERFAALTNEVFAHVGDATTLLRDALYRELDLAPPRGEAPLLRPADADPEHRPVTAFEVYTEFTTSDTVRMWRYPKAVRANNADGQHPRPSSPDAVRHLAVEEDERDLRRFQQAAVLVRRDPADENDALTWAAAMCRNYPGARVAAAATGSGCVAILKDGSLLRARIVNGRDCAEPMILASAIYAYVLQRHIGDRTVTVRPSLHEITLALARIDANGQGF